MAKQRNDILQGTLSLLVLKALQRGPMHGYNITVHIQQVSRDVLRVEEGRCTRRCTGWNRTAGSRSEWKMTEHSRQCAVLSVDGGGAQATHG